MIYTIGHSNHSVEKFVALLRAHAIGQVADVRTVPHSRRYPQFSRDALARGLHRHGVKYKHFPALGGLRKPRHDSLNTAWRHEGFRGYADYMQSGEFRSGLHDLLAFAQISTAATGNPQFVRDSGQCRTAVMCAEAAWWDCHRQLLSDALLVSGVPVQHILVTGGAISHELGPFAKTEDGKVIYPGLL